MSSLNMTSAHLTPDEFRKQLEEKIRDIMQAMYVGSRDETVSKLRLDDSRVLLDTLDHLRLTTKYRIFDLESCRREIKYLHQLLEDKRNS
jgi:hypothetical protein